MEKNKTACAICDAGPLIHLDELSCLPLLEDFTSVIVPAGVWEEARRHRGAEFSLPCERVVSPGRAAPEWESVFRSLALHRGEMEALRVAASRPRCLLLTDDMAARLAAEKCGVPAAGTVGVMVRALRRGLRTKAEVLDLLKQLPERSTLHLKPALLAKVIATVAAEDR